MNYSAHLLGATTGRTLQARAAAPILTIGRDTFTRRDLSTVECWNFLAAARLSRILTRELHVKDTRDLFERIAPTSLAVPELGAISLAVLGAAFEARGLGGDAPLDAWDRKHAAKPDAALVTFQTIKAHARAREKKPRRRRVA